MDAMNGALARQRRAPADLVSIACMGKPTECSLSGFWSNLESPEIVSVAKLHMSAKRRVEKYYSLRSINNGAS